MPSMQPIEEEVGDTIRVDIYIAGDYDVAAQWLQEYCFESPLCVHIEKIDFIYTGGREVGLKIGLLNYPRYPSNKDDLNIHAQKIVKGLISHLGQWSALIVGPEATRWFSRRGE